jgi:hypothetical protein
MKPERNPRPCLKCGVGGPLCVGHAHVFVGGNLLVDVTEGLGGKLIRTISFLRHLFASSSSSPKPVATVGGRGGRGGGLLGCGFGFCSSDIAHAFSVNRINGLKRFEES